MSDCIQIILADDHAIFRAGVKALLQMEDDLCVIDEVRDGREAYSVIVKIKPDLVLMDLSMPHANGTEVIAKIKKRCPEIRILALTVHKEEEYVRATLAAGANGYILKDDSHEELIFAIRTVESGRMYISPSVSGQLVAGYLYKEKKLPESPSWDLLSQREREVLTFIVEGLKNREIATLLSLSIKTIEKHRSSLMRKLNLKNTPALIAYAIENKLTS